MASNEIYRIDHHGSLVRPHHLNALAQAGGSSDELRAAQDEAIRDAARTQRRLLLTTVTDGEFRRSDFRDPVLVGVAGFEPTGGSEFDGFREWRNTGRVELLEPLATTEVEIPRLTTSIPTKVSLPSPAYIAAHTWLDGSTSPYASAAELGMALAPVVRAQCESLLAAGVPYIQLDNPDYALHYVDTDTGRPQPGLDVLDAIAIDTAVVDGLDRPEGATFAMALDWGDVETDSVDEQVAWEVFDALPFDRFLIPYYSDAFVDEHLIQFVPEGRQVVLGVVDARSSTLDDVDTILARIDHALETMDATRVALCPSRGFQNAAYVPASVSIEQQNRSLTHVETIARMAWGAEL